MPVCSCFSPSDRRWLSASMLSTCASTVSPFFSTSDGCLILLHDMSEMWIRPSMPSSTSTNAPNSVRLRTLPVIVVPDRIPARELVPRIGLDLLQAQRNAPRAGIDAEHHRFHLIALVEDLRRVLDALAPRHFGDVDEAFHARLELDERAVVREAHHLAGHADADRVPLDDVGPRIRHDLLVAERDALGARVVLEHDRRRFRRRRARLPTDASRGPTTCP